MKNQYRQDRQQDRQQDRHAQDRYQDRNEGSAYRREEQNSYRRQPQRGNAGGADWYTRDPMDERSGYRDDDTQNQSYANRMNSSESRGYKSPYRQEQNDSGYYGAGNSNSDRQRDNSYDSDRYSRGQGAYGTSSSGRASWEANMNSDASRWNANTDNNDSSYGHRGYNNRNEGSYDRNFNRNSSSSSTMNNRTGDRNYESDYRHSSHGNYRNDDDRTSSNTTYGATQGSWSPAGEESARSSSFYGRGPKNFKRSDERIKEEVCEMLTRHHSIDADDIEVEVKEGEVTLSGSVSERRMKHLAEDAAEQCFGVKDVVNNIRVKKQDETETSFGDRADYGANREKATSSNKKSTSTTTGTTDPKNPNH